jgi:hypothetical protein
MSTPSSSVTGCVFCGGQPLTGESVIPPSIATTLDGGGPFVAAPTAGPWMGDVWLRVRVACSACRAGWMRSLDTRARPLLSAMIEGETLSLRAAQQKTLAAWAFKTALLLTFTRPDLAGSGASQYPSHYFTDFKRTRLPPVSTLIIYGDHRGTQRAGAWSLQVFEPGPADDAITSVVTVVIARMFFQVREFASPAWRQSVPDLSDRAGLTQVWPARSQAITWPNGGVGFSADDLRRFAETPQT